MVVTIITFAVTLSLKKYNPLLCTGDIPDATISHSIDIFQNDERIDLFQKYVDDYKEIRKKTLFKKLA